MAIIVDPCVSNDDYCCLNLFRVHVAAIRQLQNPFLRWSCQGLLAFRAKCIVQSRDHNIYRGLVQREPVRKMAELKGECERKQREWYMTYTTHKTFRWTDNIKVTWTSVLRTARCWLYQTFITKTTIVSNNSNCWVV